MAKIRETFGSGPLGDRRTLLAGVPDAVDVSFEVAVEREPLTVVLSEKGWIRALRGHLADGHELKFKDGDALRLMVPCQSTDRLCLFGTNGRAYTLRAAELPRGRGDGQPIRLLAEMTNADDVATLFLWQEGIRYLVASATRPRLRGGGSRFAVGTQGRQASAEHQARRGGGALRSR